MFLVLTELGNEPRVTSWKMLRYLESLRLLGESEEEAPSNLSTLTEGQREGLEQTLEELPKLFSKKLGRTFILPIPSMCRCSTN